MILAKTLLSELLKMDPEALKELEKTLKGFKKVSAGGNRPRNSKIGVLFSQIERFLDASTLDGLNVNLDSPQGDARANVVGKALEYIRDIAVLSEKLPDAQFISIPLQDMKTVGRLLNVVIIHGIYEVVPQKYLVPIENRRLKDFRTVGKLEHVPMDENRALLEAILRCFNEVFASNSDLKDLILVGVGLTDMLNVCLVLYLTVGDNTYLKNLATLESLSSTYQLLSFYTLLMRYSQDAKLRGYLRETKLPELVMTSNGVESLIDLVLGLRENEEIDTGRIGSIAAILLNSKPSCVDTDEYYQNVFGQLYASLVFVNRPIMTTVVVELVLLLWNSGHEILVDKFLFQRLRLAFNPQPIGDAIVLTSGTDLNNAFNVVLSVVRCLKQSDQDVLHALLDPIISPLWWFANYQRKHNKDYDIVLNVIKNALLLDAKVDLVTLLIDNMIQQNAHWEFAQDGQLAIIKFNTHEQPLQMLDVFAVLDSALDTFVLLAKKVVEIDEARLDEIMKVVMDGVTSANVLGDESPLAKLLGLKLLQTMLESFRDQIEKSPMFLLAFLEDIIGRHFEHHSKLLVVKEEVDSDDEDGEDESEDLTTLLPVFELIGDWTPASTDEQQRLTSLQSKIRLYASRIPISLQPTMKRILDIDANAKIQPKQADDARLEVILKQLNDPTPSIKVYALDELSKLTLSKTKVSMKYTMNLMISQLNDNEPFVYLNAIKNIAKLACADRSQLDHLLDLYTGKKPIDIRLRLAEAIHRYIEAQNETLSPKEIDTLVHTLVGLVRPQDPPVDTRIRMSSLSLLGTVCHYAGLGILPHVDIIVDVIKGVTTFEKAQPEVRRAAIVIVDDIVRNPHGLAILKEHGPSIETMLKYVNEFDSDLLTTQLAWNTLSDIDSEFERKLTL